MFRKFIDDKTEEADWATELHRTKIASRPTQSLDTMFLGLAESKEIEISKTATQDINLKEILDQFAYGFGNIRYAGMLLTCAQIQSRKKNYLFNPTVLDESSLLFDDFKEYLTLLKNAKQPVRERFIIYSSHCISGDIEIKSDGTVNIFFLDSIKKSYVAEKAITIFASLFPEDKRTIYLSNQPRQVTMVGCSVFSLDDVRHLYTVENYLPSIDPIYKQTGLFGYLANNVARATSKLNGEEFTIESFDLTVSILPGELPFSLQRAHQSRNLLENIIPTLPTNELNAPMNKKGQTPLQFKEKNNCFVYNYIYGRNENTRLELALKKFSLFNTQFVEKNSYRSNDINEKMQQFTLKKARGSNPV